MLAIAIAAFFALAAIAAVATIAACTAQGLAQGRAIMAELAQLECQGRGTPVIALPVLRSHMARPARQRAAVSLRPLRRAVAA